MRCGEAAAPAESMDSGRVLDPMAVGQALRQLIARTEITTTRALIAASDRLASFRILTFPKSATKAEIDASVQAQLNLGHDRMATRHVEIRASRDDRTFFATVWDRSQIQAIAAAARHAGLEPAAVDLKSLCIARALPIDSCVLLDLSVEPCEVMLIDERVPSLWHTFRIDSGADIAAAVVKGLRPLLGFHQRTGVNGFGHESPIVIRSDQALPSLLTARLEQLTNRPVQTLPAPPRTDPDVRFGPYFTCLGLVMRRNG